MGGNKLSFDKVIKIILLALIVALAAGTIMSMYAPKNDEFPSGPGAGQMPGAPGSEAPGGAGGTGSNDASQAVTVSYIEAEPANISTWIKVNGDITSRSQVNMYADTAGKVLRFTKKIGDTVQKGEVIAYVDPSKAGSAYAASPVVSTVTGTIISLPYKQGDTITTQNAVAVVGSLRDLEITVYVPEKYSLTVKKGLGAQVSLTPIPDESFAAVITSVSPVVDSESRTVEVKLAFTKNDARIMPGMFAAVRLTTSESMNTLVVPKNAIKKYYDDSVVYVIDAENVARRKVVQTGLSNDGETEIVSGLSFGDLIVTAGSVTEGTAVRKAAAVL